MPVIPGQQESQVMTPGNPVPIHNTENARTTGVLTADLGQAFFHVGDQLDTVLKQQKAASDKLDVGLALQQFKQKALDKQMSLERPDAIGQVEDFRKSTQKDMMDVANTITDPMSKKAYLEQAMSEQNSLGREVFSQAVVKQVKANQAKVDMYISGQGDIVRNDITKLPHIMAEADVFISGLDNYIDTEKVALKLQAKQSIFQDGVNGAVERNQYALAKTIVDQYSGGVLTPKEKAQQLDEISSKEARYHTDLYTTSLREDTQADKQLKKETQDKFAKAIVALKLAGNDENKRAPILQDLLQQVGKDPRAVPAYEALSGNRVFSRVQDAKYAADTAVKVLPASSVDDIQVMKEKAQQDAIEGRVSFEQSEKVINLLNSRQEHIRTNPFAIIQQLSAQKQISALNSSGFTNSMSPAAASQYQSNVKAAQTDFAQQMFNNPTADPHAVMSNAIDKNIPVKNKFTYQSEKEASADMEKLTAEYMTLKTSGKMTLEKEKEFIQKLQDMNLAKTKIKPQGGGQ